MKSLKMYVTSPYMLSSKRNECSEVLNVNSKFGAEYIGIIVA